MWNFKGTIWNSIQKTSSIHRKMCNKGSLCENHFLISEQIFCCIVISFFIKCDKPQSRIARMHLFPITMTSQWARWRLKYQPHDCLRNRLFRRRAKKTPKLRVTGLCVGNSPWPMNSPHKWSITRKMFPFDYAIMPHWNQHYPAPDGYAESLLWERSMWKLAQESIWHSVSLISPIRETACVLILICVSITPVTSYDYPRFPC